MQVDIHDLIGENRTVPIRFSLFYPSPQKINTSKGDLVMKDKTKRKSNQPTQFKDYLVDTKSKEEDANDDIIEENAQSELSKFIAEDWAGLI